MVSGDCEVICQLVELDVVGKWGGLRPLGYLGASGTSGTAAMTPMLHARGTIPM